LGTLSVGGSGQSLDYPPVQEALNMLFTDWPLPANVFDKTRKALIAEKR